MRMIGALTLAVLLVASAPNAGGETRPPASSPPVAVGPQYDTTHVYVAPEDFDRFVASLLATFGGTTSKQGVFTVTPTPSSTMNQLVLTPVGTLSVFGFKTPVPYPFGLERTGYLVTDMDAAVRAARACGADVIVAPFDDPIGRDAIVQWPGGVNMQLYWHTTPPSYADLQTVPENRVYLSDGTYRRVRLTSTFGTVVALVTDGHLPYPYGREMTGYETLDLDTTLARAKSAGVRVLVEPYSAADRRSAFVQFPGGYIAEIHATVRK